MYSFVMFPLLLFFPVLSYKYLTEYFGNHPIKCECSFVSDTEMKTWECFIIKFNYLNNKSKTNSFLEVVNKFVEKYGLEYETNVHINATNISLRILNDDHHSFNTVVDILNSTDICLINSTDSRINSNHVNNRELDESCEEYNDEESDEESDEYVEELKEQKPQEFFKFINKMVESIIDDSVSMSREKTIKSLLSDVVLKNIINDVINTENIYEDSSKNIVIEEETQETQETQEKQEAFISNDIEEFELIRSNA